MEPKTGTNEELERRISKANDAIYQAMQAACVEPGVQGRCTYRLLLAAEIASRLAHHLNSVGVSRYEVGYINEKIARIREELDAALRETDSVR